MSGIDWNIFFNPDGFFRWAGALVIVTHYNEIASKALEWKLHYLPPKVKVHLELFLHFRQNHNECFTRCVTHFTHSTVIVEVKSRQFITVRVHYIYSSVMMWPFNSLLCHQIEDCEIWRIYYRQVKRSQYRNILFICWENTCVLPNWLNHLNI